MRILIVWIHRISGHLGGTQRALIGLANAMAARGHAVTLAECTEYGGAPPFPVHAGVRLVNLADDLPGGRVESDRMPRAMKIQREAVRLFSPDRARLMNERFAIRRVGDALLRLLRTEAPDVVAAGDMETASAVRAVMPRGGAPIVAMTHVSAAAALRTMTSLDRHTAAACRAVQCLTPAACQAFERQIPRGRYVCIPNAVPPAAEAAGAGEPLIVSVGRLHRRIKRQHLLIRAFALLAEDFPEWRLELWGIETGRGGYTEALAAEIAALHLEGRVLLCGETHDAPAVYRRAALFAQASEDEGFGLAMGEAMSAGLPAVACRSSEGARALAEGGGAVLTNGTAEALAAGLRPLMADEALRRSLGEAARQGMKRYAPAAVDEAWEALLKDAIKNHYVVI